MRKKKSNPPRHSMAVTEVTEVNPREPLPPREEDDLQVPLFEMAAINEFAGILREPTMVPLGTCRSGKTKFRNGDVLFAKITPCVQNGKSALVAGVEGDLGFGSSEFYVLRAKSQILPEYLFFFVRQKNFVHAAVESFAGTSGRQRVPSTFWDRLTILVPPLPVQERIVQILQKADEVRRERQEALELTDDILSAVYHDMFGDPEKNTKGYEVHALIDLVKDKKRGIKCGPFGSQLLISELTSKGIPVLGIENVERNQFIDTKNKYVTPEKYLKLKSFKVVLGDVLITRTGTAGRACLLPDGFPDAIIGPNLLKVTIDPNEFLPEVFALSINYNPSVIQQIKRLSPGSTVAVFNLPNLKRILFTVPPIKIQKEFLRQYQQIQQLKAGLVQGLKIAEENLKALLARTFTGELTAGWEEANVEWIAQQVDLSERLPRLVLLALIREKAVRVEKLAQTAILVTALMKYAFLLQMEGQFRHGRVRRFYNFVPYHYGPFAKEVYADLKKLHQEGLIRVRGTGWGAGETDTSEILMAAEEQAPYWDDSSRQTQSNRIEISLNDVENAQKILVGLPDDLKEDVAAIIDAYGDFDHNVLLKTVYDKYPAYARKSRIARKRNDSDRMTGREDR